jgi:Restriction endonuclease
VRENAERKREEERHERIMQEIYARDRLQAYQKWRLQHSALVDKFLALTERKISLLDDYGDENWDVLPKEIQKLLLKAARTDNEDIRLPRAPLSTSGERIAWADKHHVDSLLLAKYLDLGPQLELEFRSYHRSHKQDTVASDFKDLSGEDFETYLAKVLKECGFEDISGTPTTGDQGADLIAKRSGHTVVIQAKRYQGSVGNRAVQEVVGAIKFYGADWCR